MLQGMDDCLKLTWENLWANEAQALKKNSSIVLIMYNA